MRKTILAFILSAGLLVILALQARPAAADARLNLGAVGALDTPTALSIVPVVTSTPNADGSVYHEVQYGQTIIDIASAYNMTPADLMALNGLDAKSVIMAGSKLVIVPAPTITPTPTITDTPQPTDRPTRTPRPPTRTPGPTRTPTTPPTPSPTPEPPLISVQLDERSLGITLIALCVAGLVLVGIVSFRNRTP